MIRKTLLACGVALPMLVLGLMPAKAGTDVNIQLGVPFYDHQVNSRYRYHEGYGWYDGQRYGDRNFRRVSDDDDDDYDYDDDDGGYVDAGYGRRRLSCRQAAYLVQRRGFSRVKARSCEGRVYVFRARRDGDSYVIYVNSRNGRMRVEN